MTGSEYDLKAIVGDVTNSSGIEHGELLCRFVDVALKGTAEELVRIRRDVRSTFEDEAFVDICSNVASFNSVVKIADGCGIPLEDVKENNTRDIRETLGIDRFKT